MLTITWTLDEITENELAQQIAIANQVGRGLALADSGKVWGINETDDAISGYPGVKTHMKTRIVRQVNPRGNMSHFMVYTTRKANATLYPVFHRYGEKDAWTPSYVMRETAGVIMSQYHYALYVGNKNLSHNAHISGAALGAFLVSYMLRRLQLDGYKPTTQEVETWNLEAIKDSFVLSDFDTEMLDPIYLLYFDGGEFVDFGGTVSAMPAEEETALAEGVVLNPAGWVPAE